MFKIALNMFFGLEITGRENMPKKGPFIVAANHVSYIDPAVVGAACFTTPLTFMAKKELFDNPIFGWWFKAVDCVPVGRDESKLNFGAIKEVIKKLKEGKAVGIFPEGTRSSDGKFKKPEPGIGLIAIKTKAPIVPVYVTGTENAMPKGQKFIRLCKIRAKIGKAIDIDYSENPPDKRRLYESIGEKVMDAISELKT